MRAEKSRATSSLLAIDIAILKEKGSENKQNLRTGNGDN